MFAVFLFFFFLFFLYEITLPKNTLKVLHLVFSKHFTINMPAVLSILLNLPSDSLAVLPTIPGIPVDLFAKVAKIPGTHFGGGEEKANA